MTQLIALISSFRSDDEGQGLAEYALILALIAIVAIIALIFLAARSARSSTRSAPRSRTELRHRTPSRRRRKARRLVVSGCSVRTVTERSHRPIDRP